MHVTLRAQSRSAMTGRDPQSLVYTVGHSTRSLDEFVGLLKGHNVDKVADVRTVPRSRHNPQFETCALESALAACGIAYEHMPGLGGFRRADPSSPNGGWRNLSFRGYADYMQAPEFARSLEALVSEASHWCIAVMCAEAVPWRCHRSLIADALIVRGCRVMEITGKSAARDHSLTPFAKVDGESITYPPESTEPVSSSEALPLHERAHAVDGRGRQARK